MTRACSKCDAPITRKSKTGLCRNCSRIAHTYASRSNGLETPPQSLIEMLVRTASADSASAALREAGYMPSHDACKAARAAEIARRDAARAAVPIQPMFDMPPVPPPAAPSQAPIDTWHEKLAKFGSEQLEERLLALYARTAKRLGCSTYEAFERLNYSPAVLAKMAGGGLVSKVNGTWTPPRPEPMQTLGGVSW